MNRWKHTCTNWWNRITGFFVIDAAKTLKVSQTEGCAISRLCGRKVSSALIESAKLVCLISLTTLSGRNAAHAAPTIQSNMFPVMAWDQPPNNLETFKKMREAGLTIAGFVAPDALANCQAAGLKAFVLDKRAFHYDWRNVDLAQTKRNITALVREVGKNPAVCGYFLRDEPSVQLFAGLGKVASLLRQLSPGKIPYINLLPNYANAEQLGTTNYSQYLEDYICTCHPSVLSYDNYALMDNGTVRQSYWSNLEAVRNACKRHGLDFWNVILSVAHFNYHVPTPAGLRFEVYTTLAYGTRGIVYFTYFARPSGNYRKAPIDQFGHQTPTWYYMQNVNLQVQKLAPTLLKLTSDEVYHFGKIPQGCHGPSKDSLIEHLGGGNFVVGDFSGSDGLRYALIVNEDLQYSHRCLPKLRHSHALEMVSPYTGRLVPFTGEQMWLAPGAGVLLKVN